MKLTKQIISVIKWIVIFFASFLLYHILFSSFFPVDENNVLQAPNWYMYLGLWLSVVAATLCTVSWKHGRNKGQSNTITMKTVPGGAQKIPASKKKQSELATGILTNIETCVNLANKTDRVSLFVRWYDEAINGFATLMKLEKVKFINQPAFDYYKLKDEFQWHLCDAIDRSKATAISEIRIKYKNSREFQERTAEAFERDINSVKDRFSNDTAEFANKAIEDVKRAAGVRTIATAPNPSTTLDQFSNHGEPQAELMTIDLMEGHAFEYWCAKLLTDIGYSNVSVTQGSGDQGVDVLAQKDGIKYAIQCKCYASDLGNTPVQEVNAGKTIYHCHIGAVMTNRYFTAGAKEAAAATGVLLWDRDWITQALEQRSNQ